jgi:hypothetical protein
MSPPRAPLTTGLWVVYMVKTFKAIVLADISLSEYFLVSLS